MTIQDTLGTLIVPGTVPTGNLLWVDSVSGNDSLAARGRMVPPFKTLAAAKGAATSGDTIIVMPGTYNERNLLKNGVNWHFLPGAKVVVTGTGGGAIFDTSSSYGTGGAVTAMITGYGEFSINVADSSANVINSAASGSHMFFQARSLAGLSTADTVRLADGEANLDVREGITASEQRALTVLGAATAVVRARSISTGNSYTIDYAGTSLAVHAHTISAGVGSGGAVAITGGTGSVLVEAYEILGGDGYTSVVRYHDTASVPTLTLKGARIQSLSGAASTARAVDIGASGSGKVKFMNCVLLVNTSVADSSIYASNSGTNVQMHGLTVANKAKHANVVPKPTSGFDSSGGTFIT